MKFPLRIKPLRIKTLHKLRLFFIILAISSGSLMAQPGGGPGLPPAEGDPSSPPTGGGGAPIGSGLGILLALGAAYAGRKAYMLYNGNDSLEE